MKFFVYLHRRASDGRIFYVGKGCRYRHKSKWGRSTHWHNIVNKHGYTIEIAQKDLSEAEAFALEIELIAKYKDQGLCNRTDGGEGASGVIVSEETKAKHRALRWTKEWRDNISQKAKERYSNPEYRARQKRVRLEAMNRPEVKEKLRKRSIEQFANLRARLNAAKKAKEHFENPESRALARELALARFDTPEKRAAHAQAKAIRCIETGVIFGTGTLAAEWVSTIIGKKADNSTIARAARSGRASYNFHWAYITEATEVLE